MNERIPALVVDLRIHSCFLGLVVSGLLGFGLPKGPLCSRLVAMTLINCRH